MEMWFCSLMSFVRIKAEGLPFQPPPGTRVWLPLFKKEEEDNYTYFNVEFLDWDSREPNVIQIYVVPGESYEEEPTAQDYLDAGWERF